MRGLTRVLVHDVGVSGAAFEDEDRRLGLFEVRGAAVEDDAVAEDRQGSLVEVDVPGDDEVDAVVVEHQLDLEEQVLVLEAQVDAAVERAVRVDDYPGPDVAVLVRGLEVSADRDLSREGEI